MKLIKILVIGYKHSEYEHITKTNDIEFELTVSETKDKEAINLINELNPDLLMIDLNYPEPLKGLSFVEKIAKKFNLPQVIISDQLDHKSIKKSKKVNPAGFIDFKFLSNHLFPIYIDFIVNKHKRDNLLKDDRKTESQTIQELLKEIQSSRQIINSNAKELIALSTKFTEFQEKSKENIRNKDKFFSIIAHDMKGPLQGLIGYTEILATDTSTLSSDEIKEIATDLHSSAKLLLELLEDFLHWSRIQRGAIDSEPSVQNLHQIVKLNFDLLGLQANQKQIHLINNVEQEQTIFADLNMVNTILRNLISNAIKFTFPNGKIEITSSLKNDGMVEIKVKDNGKGIAPADLQKIFRLDMQFTTTGTANEQGTGLGLILCKELVEKNHGTISVESEPGKGTVFTIEIPSSKEAYNQNLRK
jgi:signal transduction histidine kinase